MGLVKLLNIMANPRHTIVSATMGRILAGFRLTGSNMAASSYVIR
jgi:hypothetical protein